MPSQLPFAFSTSILFISLENDMWLAMDVDPEFQFFADPK